MQVRRAIISVHNKEGVVEFAKSLSGMGISILSSGGTASLLLKSGIKVTEVSKATGSPEMFGGRVKTLHPKIHGGILADRMSHKHMEEAKALGIELIDLVVVNLYPFEQTVRKGAGLDEVVENIDIGGPTLIRAAAKNYGSVAVICDPREYAPVLDELKRSSRTLSHKTLERLAVQAWNHVAHYDVSIEQYFRRAFGFGDEFPEYLNLTFRKKQELRYGENPHQRASVYRDDFFGNPSILDAKQLHGKELSYNNILDCNAAFKLIREFEEPTKSVDPEASFGGVVALNRKVDERLAREITSKFVDIVIAPGFDEAALNVLKQKKNMRIMDTPGLDVPRKPYRKYRSILGGLLTQDANVRMLEDLKVVTKRQPSDKERRAMLYAWKIVKYVKSNAIVFARENRAVGIGAGQMKRIDAAKLASMIAKGQGEELRGCAMASDAFFPFRDGIDFAASLGITAVIQPGGSIKDAEVIKAADEHNMAMIFTGIRHFRH
jgi:phosphoribosylaminoimidazolecarboxamide formyltransferase/IMP cyclohydrolase